MKRIWYSIVIALAACLLFCTEAGIAVTKAEEPGTTAVVAEEPAAEGSAAQTFQFSAVQNKFKLDAQYGGSGTTVIAIKKDKSLWDVVNGKKITTKVKEASVIYFGNTYRVLALKTNGKLYLLYPKASGKWGARRLLSGVKELAKEPYYQAGAKYYIYAVKKNGNLMKGVVKLNSAGTNVTKKTWKKVLGSVAHAYIACYSHSNWDDLTFYAIRKNGDLYAWGGNSKGEVGNGKTKKVSSPVRVLQNVKSLTCIFQMNGTAPSGGASTFAITRNGDLYGWGVNDFYTVKMGAGDIVKKPLKLLSNVQMVDGSDHVTIALTKDGTLWTWGTDIGNTTAEGTTVYHVPIDRTKIAKNVIAADVDSITIYYVKSNHTLWYQGGAPSSRYEKTIGKPAKLTGKVSAVKATGTYGTFILKTDGSLYGIDYNNKKGTYIKKFTKMASGFPK